MIEQNMFDLWLLLGPSAMHYITIPISNFVLFQAGQCRLLTLGTHPPHV